MIRLYVLIDMAIKNNEPILLVGSTGTGKTTISKIISEVNKRPFYSLNCHQHTETSDIIGGLRPIRLRNLLR